MQSDLERSIRKQFFAYRNGILADTLRSAGNVYSVIFGLNLHQIVEIASQVTPNAELSQSLWNDKKCREARLIAPMLMPRDVFSKQMAMQWCEDVSCYEEADVFCHRLLRYMAYASDIVKVYYKSDEAIKKYLAYRLLLNLLTIGAYKGISEANEMAKTELQNATPMLRNVLQAIIDATSM